VINKVAENPPAYGIVFGVLSMVIYPLFDFSITGFITPYFEGFFLGILIAFILIYVGFERMKILSYERDLAESNRKKSELGEEG